MCAGLHNQPFFLFVSRGYARSWKLPYFSTWLYEFYFPFPFIISPLFLAQGKFQNHSYGISFIFSEGIKKLCFLSFQNVSTCHYSPELYESIARLSKRREINVCNMIKQERLALFLLHSKTRKKSFKGQKSCENILNGCYSH